MRSAWNGVHRASRAVLALAIAGALTVSACGGDDDDEQPPPSASTQKLVILHTNDLHSHLMGFAPEQDYTPATVGDDATVGGAARLAAAIAAGRARAEGAKAGTLLLDAGDFMMGTLFELLATNAAPELSFLQSMKYDATTLGNHEFDWTPTGLAGILAAAAQQGVNVPIVASNTQFSADDAGDDLLAGLAQNGAIQSKLVKTVGGLKIGIFGLLGADAAQVTPQAAPVTFEPIATTSARLVQELRDEDHVDLVIALSHSGIYSNGEGEDRELAKAVPGIDVIVSGHTHDSLSAPVQEGKTLIVTAGAYSAYLGELSLEVTPASKAGEQAKVVVDGYTLHDIDDSIEGSAAVQSVVDAYVDGIDSALADSGLAYRAVVATTPGDLAFPQFQEAPVGNLVADAYRAAASKLDPAEPAQIGFDANGQIRAPILMGSTGEVWLADLFRVVPLGIGPDKRPGFPLVSYYLNASDIISGLELGAAPEVASNDYFLQVSGLKVEYDSSRPVFGRVSKASLVTDSGEQELDPTDTDTCYKVVSTNYVAGLLGVVEKFTAGLLAVRAKDDDCKTLVDPTTRF
ncbi:MAG TPA: bifunctional UDP-sugar hydrolase/5'-nucleotidase, partial [Polyangiaceae bacterium]|nr:bifunctional UDP-sugar hydrolase/5'-nucleotidase [Polyangiaceae bacterium]